MSKRQYEDYIKNGCHPTGYNEAVSQYYFGQTTVDFLLNKLEEANKLLKNERFCADVLNSNFELIKKEKETLKAKLEDSEYNHELLIRQFEEETENLRKQIKTESDARKRFVKEVKELKRQLKKKDEEITQRLVIQEKEYFEELAEKNKEIEEVRSNHANLVADIAYKAVNVYTAESKETGVPTFYKIHYSQLLEIEDMDNLRNYAQDKISFAVEQLEEVKENINKVPITAYDFCGNFEKMYKRDAIRQVDKQIKQLKETQ